MPVSASSELEMSGFVIVQETDSGRWEIQAHRASYMDEKEVLLNNVSARIISGGEDRISVVSDTGRFESDRLVLHLEGNVIIASHWGSSLQAPAVKWNGSDDYLEASGGVKLQRGSIIIYGSSAHYTINTGVARILGKVRTILENGKNSP
jgi:LPS export ABC transporter protein LptC